MPHVPDSNSFIDAMSDGSLDVTTVAKGFAPLLDAAPKVFRRSLQLVEELVKVVGGKSDVEFGKDKRFADDTWSSNKFYRTLGQAYLTWAKSVHELIDDLDLDEKGRLKGHFLANLLTETVAPTNTLLGNPAALAETVRTGGTNLRAGALNALKDLRDNGGMPSMVDTTPFVVGETVAVTKGSVVFRSEVIELIRYEPTTPQVYERAVLIVPPQINRYYVLDLAPGRSMAQAAVEAGQQVFMISWRNPGPEQRDWDLDTYAKAIIEATDVVLELTDREDLNVMGVCSGGITTAAVLGYFEAIGDRRVNSVTFPVTVLDWDAPSVIGTITAGPNVSISIQQSQAKGILAGSELGKLFAWMRPNDLIWNYWVNNYLMGRTPPAFDVLAWNVDNTNLPAGLHADFMSITSENRLTHPGGVEVLGKKVDLASVTTQAYVVAGETDHITPWQGCYRTLDMLGGPSEFVLVNSGHIQTLVCPVDNPKARYFMNPDRAENAEHWRAGATEQVGSWWTHWLAWMSVRSGEMIAPPRNLGNRRYRSLAPAPGTYVVSQG